MLLSTNYRKPFWRGFFHAVAVLLFTIFVSLVLMGLSSYVTDTTGPLLIFVFSLFMLVVTMAVCGYLIFFEPVKYMLHHKFQSGTVMLSSTLGWLFIFLLVFVMGFVVTAV